MKEEMKRQKLFNYSNWHDPKSEEYLETRNKTENLKNIDKIIPKYGYQQSSDEVLEDLDNYRSEYTGRDYYKSNRRVAGALHGIQHNKNLSLGQKVVASQFITDRARYLYSPGEFDGHNFGQGKGIADNVLNSGNFRMSKKYVDNLEKEGRKYYEDRYEDTYDLVRHEKDLGSTPDLKQHTNRFLSHKHGNKRVELMDKARSAIDVIDKESDLSNSKYDDKYSSKRVEKFLDKKIDADKAKNIVDRRHSNDSKYQEKDTEKGRNRDNFHVSDINRKWEDTGIVYNEALGRNLNKDAAIAAGVTAGLGLGIHAIRKHNKKKKASKDQVESKYKTKKK